VNSVGGPGITPSDVNLLAVAIISVGLLASLGLFFAGCVLHCVSHELKRIADALLADDETEVTIRDARAETILQDLRQERGSRDGMPWAKPQQPS
jgi:hypothetical protein